MIARGLLRAVNTIDLTPPHLRHTYAQFNFVRRSKALSKFLLMHETCVLMPTPLPTSWFLYSVAVHGFCFAPPKPGYSAQSFTIAHTHLNTPDPLTGRFTLKLTS